MGKTSAKVHNRYIQKAYDRINLVVRKGQKERIKAAADAVGVSVNAYISKAIAEKMERDGFTIETETE
jgi:predicted HicB family RNase H-like nuclease